ncbi:hypothetical protein HHO41_14585 [Bacillus sp. DNRA2]|uniref:hypothetical protein n=1 Tax=Bacillus sp. DNRA2 TaxID=2723053 RepID=UPI00145F03FA|nr:hypothetical protein [Bacillus sp. DNRA2]NMD71529.1 hypothetical protein [Bacillus sp. DNRA2]
MNLKNLKEMVKPFGDNSDSPYFRPFVCNGDESNYDIFLVGINPATPISMKDMDIDKYVNLLIKYDDFYKEYQKIRENAGKTTISRTRKGTVNFVNELGMKTGKAILETNVIPYPTSNIKELKEIPDNVKKYAMNLFYSVLIQYTPEVIIVFSKTSLKYLLEIMCEHKIIESKVSTKKPIKVIEDNSNPFIQFSYLNGKKGAIFVCRHLMYYGDKGNSFSKFREKVINYLNSGGK